MMEETVILNFEVDQGQAEQQLKKVEGLILDNKKAQQELTKALKQGTITQDEYIDENIRLQQNLKKEQEQKKTLTRLLQTESNSRNAVKNRVSQLAKEYDNLNLKTAQGAKRADELEKELAQLNAQLTKGDKAAGLFKNQIGNYPQQFAEAAKGINVAGVSVGDLTGKFGAFLNPATAVIGIVTALGAAYARSTVGSRDLKFAQEQLAASVSILSEKFGNLVSGAESGGGTITKVLDGIIDVAQYIPIIAIYSKAIGIDFDQIQEDSKKIAENLQRLEDLEISRAFAAGDAKEDERRAELARRERDNEKKALDERIAASQTIDDLLKRSGERSKIVIEAQIEAIKNSTVGYENNRQAQLTVAQLTAEIADKQEEITGKLTENVTARQKLIQLQKEELELFGFDIREANAPGTSSLTGQNVLDPLKLEASGENSDLTAQAIESSKARQEQFISELKTVEFTEEQKRDQAIQTAALREKLDREAVERERATADGFLAIGSALANGLSALAKEGSEEQKALAITGIAIDTAAAIAGAVASAQDIPYPGNLGAMASAIAAVLAAIAEAKAIGGFAEGGWTGPGNKHDVAGYVHADEYVVPKSINNSPAAQPHLAALERMRTGYADGGYVANLNTQSANNSLLIANAFKNLPAPQVSWVEGRAVGNKVQWKEAKASI